MIDKGNFSEIKMLLKQVILYYSQRTKELEKEKVKMEKLDSSALRKGFEDMKKHVDESNEKWRMGIKQKLGKVNAEIQQMKNEMEVLKERGTNIDPRNEEPRREVEKLKKWREECANKENGKAKQTQDPKAAGTS